MTIAVLQHGADTDGFDMFIITLSYQSTNSEMLEDFLKAYHRIALINKCALVLETLMLVLVLCKIFLKGSSPLMESIIIIVRCSKFLLLGYTCLFMLRTGRFYLQNLIEC